LLGHWSLRNRAASASFKADTPRLELELGWLVDVAPLLGLLMVTVWSPALLWSGEWTKEKLSGAAVAANVQCYSAGLKPIRRATVVKLVTCDFSLLSRSHAHRALRRFGRLSYFQCGRDNVKGEYYRDGPMHYLSGMLPGKRSQSSYIAW
jgi:hypothetical protein